MTRRQLKKKKKKKKKKNTHTHMLSKPKYQHCPQNERIMCIKNGLQRKWEVKKRKNKRKGVVNKENPSDRKCVNGAKSGETTR